MANILEETDERSTVVNQYQVLSSTVKGIFSQKEYFNKDIASEDNKGYKVVRRGNVVLSPQNLWMGNINYNNRFEVGIVSPSYKIYSIKKGFNPTFIAALLKTKKALPVFRNGTPISAIFGDDVKEFRDFWLLASMQEH